MILLLSFAFLAGLVTVLSPCILPVLPVVLASALGSSRWRPAGVVLGLVVSFAFFTLTLTAIVTLLGVPADWLRLGGGVVIGAFGLTLLAPPLLHRFELLSGRLAGLQSAGSGGGGFWSGALVGASLGLVWAPCAGPILAGVTTLVATNRLSAAAVAVTASYAIGAGVPMLAIAYGGRRAVSRIRGINQHTATMQRAFGVVMVAFALTFFAGIDRTVQAALVQSVPIEWTNALIALEDQAGVREALDDLEGKRPESRSAAPEAPSPVAESRPATIASSRLPDLGRAPELEGITGWINGEAVSVESLRGKVVLVDFWTYSCINCIRTLPYLNEWHDRYGDEGLVIIGIHTPEFEFEKSRGNVERATQQYGIEYLVAMDNGYATWQAYDNLYWPAKYLVDANGRIRYTHFGEGEYQETEEVIRALLAEAGTAAVAGESGLSGYTLSSERTPELYLGAAREEHLLSSGRYSVGEPQRFSAPDKLPLHFFSFTGEWLVEREYAQPGPGAQLDLHFRADQVYLVLTPEEDGATVEVMLDGRPVAESVAGGDVQGGILQLDGSRLYHLVNQRGVPSAHILSLRFETGSTRAFAFTFG